MAPAEPETPVGNFGFIPGPDGPIAEPPGDLPPSFDPARSVPLEDNTTPTRREWRNQDGTTTTELWPVPVRHRGGPDGHSWIEDDATLAPGTDGRLRPRALPGASSLAPRAGGDLATVDTPAGPVSLRHPGARRSEAAIDGPDATYPGIRSQRDVTLTATRDGLEETITLHSAAAGATSTEELVLPPAATARQGEGGVEILDASGSVSATYSDGWAFDASFPGGGAGAAPFGGPVTAGKAAVGGCISAFFVKAAKQYGPFSDEVVDAADIVVDVAVTGGSSDGGWTNRGFLWP